MLSGVVVMSTLDQAMNYLADVAQGYTWGPRQSLSLTRKGCNGTINNAINYRIRSDKKAIWLHGRVYISNYSRTGANPGFTFADIGIPANAQSCIIGYRGESPSEVVSLYWDSRNITTTETFSNAGGTRLTFVIPSTIVPILTS